MNCLPVDDSAAAAARARPLRRRGSARAHARLCERVRRRRANDNGCGSAAFTLLEVLMAVTIGGALVIAAVVFAFSMAELWGSGSEIRLFEQHVRGVSRFLEAILQQAEPPPEEEGQSSIARRTQEAQEQLQQNQEAVARGGAEGQVQEQANAQKSTVVWQKPRGRDFGNEELLTFELPESPGVLPWPGQPLPDVVCSLRVDPQGRGLFLLWKSRLESDFETASPRELRISPFVTGITYFYYDTKGEQSQWDVRDQPRPAEGGEPELPQRIRLTFTYEGDIRTADLVLPGTATGVPIY